MPKMMLMSTFLLSYFLTFVVKCVRSFGKFFVTLQKKSTEDEA